MRGGNKATRVVTLPSTRDYERWLERWGDSVEVVNVAHNRKVMVTFRGPAEATKWTDWSQVIGAVVAIGAAVWIGSFVLSGSSGTSSAPRASAAAAAATVPVPTTPAPTPHIGSAVEAGNWRYSVRQSDVTKTFTSGSGFLATTRTAKGLWVIVLIQLTNIGKENFSINFHDFELRDDKGIKYSPEFITDLNPPPGYTNLGESFPPGVPLLTRLYFDVAPGTNGMRLQLVQPKLDIRLE